jgi:hypothetical protein
LLSNSDIEADEETGEEPIDDGECERHSCQVCDYLDKVDAVYTGLSAECPAVASLFLDTYGAIAWSSRKPVPTSYRSFFLQASSDIDHPVR